MKFSNKYDEWAYEYSLDNSYHYFDPVGSVETCQHQVLIETLDGWAIVSTDSNGFVDVERFNARIHAVHAWEQLVVPYHDAHNCGDD